MCAVLDQGFFALSNLALSVLLARWLPQQAYGAFALVFSLFLLFGVVYSALLPEPMLVFGPVRFDRSFTAYLQLLLVGHVLVTGVGSTLFACAGAVMWWKGSATLASAFWAWGVAIPCVTLSWLLRRACFTRGRPELAAAAGAAQLVLMLGVLASLWAAGAVTLVAAVVAAAGVSVMTSAWLLARLRSDEQAAEPLAVSAGEVFRSHWEYGRWTTASGVLSWVSLGSYDVVLPRWWGIEATAALRALFTLGIPVAHAQAALTTLLIPSLVRTRGTSRFDQSLRWAFVGFGVSSVAGWMVLGFMSGPLVHAIYGGRYDSHSHVLWWVAAVPVVSGIADLLRSALRALERPEQVFLGHGLAAAMTATLGMALTHRLGLTGAVIGQIVSGVASIALLSAVLARTRHAAASRGSGMPTVGES